MTAAESRQASTDSAHRTPDSGLFRTTRWSLVVAAGGAGDAAARAALTWLCEAYWSPLLAHARRRGCDAEAAQDAVQGFFARLLERRDLAADPARGRFRAYLLGALDHFLANLRDRDRAQKRGGGRAAVPLDAVGEPAADGRSPEQAFARAWALALLDRVLAALRAEHAGRDAARFAALSPYLAGNGEAASYASAGATLGMSEGAVKVAVHRLRRRYRELLRAEIAATLAEPDEAAIAAELADLFAALRG